MRSRLAALGVEGVRARTFHSAALAQLRRFARRSAAGSSRRRRCCCARSANPLPAPYKFRPAGDLATEIEWAKNRRLTPADVPRAASATTSRRSRPTSCTRVFREYERRKADARRDRLRGPARARDPRCSRRTSTRASSVRERYRAFTVDEYQDVNLLQQTLLDLWLGERDDAVRRRRRLPVDLRVHRRDARVPARAAAAVPAGARSSGSRRTTARRRRCSSSRTGSCRSSAAPRRRCAATLPDGPEPERAAAAASPTTDALVVERIARCRDGVAARGEGRPRAGRTRARPTSRRRSTRRGIPFQGASLLARDAARRLLKALARERLDGGRARVRARGASRRAGSSARPRSSASAS